MWEGGSRVVGLVSGFGVAQAMPRGGGGGRVSYELVYCADWLPTLVGLALGPTRTVEAWRQLIPARPAPNRFAPWSTQRALLNTVGDITPGYRSSKRT